MIFRGNNYIYEVGMDKNELEPIFIYLTQPKYSKLSDPVHQNTKC